MGLFFFETANFAKALESAWFFSRFSQRVLSVSDVRLIHSFHLSVEGQGLELIWAGSVPALGEMLVRLLTLDRDSCPSGHSIPST